MKIALITDTHFGAKNGNIGFHEYFEKFYTNFFFPYLEREGISTIIDLGDTFDKRKSIDFDSLNRCREYWFDPIEKKGINLHIIVGNHCTPFRSMNSINSPSLLLGDYRSVRVYPYPQEVQFDSLSILMVPWICSETALCTKDLIESTTSPVLLGHLELAGFEMHKGILHSGGMLSDGLSKFRMVCSGHFHHKSTNRNINYLGCPYEMSWADYNDPKGFHVLDTETLELTFVENPYKMFVKIFYDDSDWNDISDSRSIPDITGSFIKLIVVNKKNAYWFDQFQKEIEAKNPLNLQVEDIKFSLDLEVEGSDNLEDSVDILEILNNSVESVRTDYDRSELKEFMTGLYFEAIDRR